MIDQRDDANQHLSWPLVLGVLLSTSLAIILAGQVWRSSPVELTCGWPILNGWSGWRRVTPALAVSSGIISVGLLWYGHRRACALRLTRPWAGLVLLYSAALSYVWFVLPATAVEAIHWIVAGVFLLAAAALVLPGARWPDVWRGNWGVKPYLYLDLLMVALPLAVWLHFRAPVDAGRATFSFLTYPVYALFQLTALLVLPSALMRRLGLPRRGIVISCAAMFALVHWPNPVVMAATFGAMIPWSLAHHGGRRLLMSAVVMGVAATSFTRFMPVSWTELMKVGPGLVRLRAVELLGGRGEIVVEKLAANVVDPVAFLEKIYPAVIGREATPRELENWDAALTRGLRCHTIYFLVTIEEYRLAAEKERMMPPPPAGLHWTQVPPLWRQRIEALGSEEFWQAHGANVDGFFRAVWIELFRHEWPATAPGYISRLLNPPQCRRLVEVLHEQRTTLRDHPFESIADEDLLWVR